MKVNVNDSVHEYPDNTNLESVLTQLDLRERRGIAVALNGSVIVSTRWAEAILSENDVVLIIQASQGG